MTGGVEPGAADDVVPPAATAPDEPAIGGRPRRPPGWSPRRGPAAAVAAFGALATGALLYQAVCERVGRPSWRWHVAGTAGLLPDHITDWWLLAAALAIAGVGLLLVVVALAPGAGRRLPMTEVTTDVRAVLDRSAAAALLREAALQVPGVIGVRIRVRGRRATAWAGVVADGSAEVWQRLASVLTTEGDRLGLARSLRLRLYVHELPAPSEAPAD